MGATDFNPSQLDHALAMYLGQELTPEIAAHIRAMAMAGEAIAPPLPPRPFGDGFVFHVERLARCRMEVRRLWREQWDVTEVFRASQGFNPDMEQFVRDNEVGRLLLLTCRNGSGILAGVLGFYLYRSRHSQQRVAGDDFFYVTPTERTPMLGAAFLRYGIDCLRKLDVTGVLFSTKTLPNVPDVSPIMRRLGFHQFGLTWSLDIPENLQGVQT